MSDQQPRYRVELEPQWITVLLPPYRGDDSPSRLRDEDEAAGGPGTTPLDDERSPSPPPLLASEPDEAGSASPPPLLAADQDDERAPTEPPLVPAPAEIEQPTAAIRAQATAVVDAPREEVVEQVLEDWLATPPAPTLPPPLVAGALERALADELDLVLSDLLNRRIAVDNLVYALEPAPPPDRPRVLGVKIQAPGDLLEGAGLLAEEIRAQLAYTNPDFGLTPGERETARATVRNVVRRASDTSEFESAVERARDLRQAARDGRLPPGQALEDAAVAADEALILHVIATLRLHLATLISVDAVAGISEAPRPEFLDEWRLVLETTQPILDAARTRDHAAVLERWTALVSNLDPILRRLAEWSERQRVVVNVLRAAALTGAAASLLEAGAAVFGPAGGLGPGGFAGGGAAAVVRVSPPTASVNAAVLAVSAAAMAAGGGTPAPPAPPATSGGAGGGAGGGGGPDPPWQDQRLPRRLRALWQARLRTQPDLATNFEITAERRNPGILGIFDEINATDGSEWSYRVRDRRTGVTAQIDGWTGEGGPDDLLGRQRLVEVKSDQGFRTTSRRDPVPRNYDVLDRLRGTPRTVADVIERRRTAIGEFRQERWSEQMLRQAELAAGNGMVVEWRCTGPRSLRIANALVDRLGLRGQVFVVDASALVVP